MVICPKVESYRFLILFLRFSLNLICKYFILNNLALSEKRVFYGILLWLLGDQFKPYGTNTKILENLAMRRAALIMLEQV